MFSDVALMTEQWRRQRPACCMALGWLVSGCLGAVLRLVCNEQPCLSPEVAVPQLPEPCRIGDGTLVSY
jgi:hypothetical protein